MSRSPGRRFLRWLLGAGLGFAAAVAGGLMLGAAEVDDPSRPAAIAAGDPRPLEDAERRPAGGRRHRVPATAMVSLEGAGSLPVMPDRPPAAGAVFDLETGEALWRREPRAERPIASLTKIMTALLVVDDLARPTRQVKIPAEAVGAAASGGVTGSAIGLEEGMRVETGALFQAMLIASHNDAATALAVQAAGSEAAFVERMNRRARRLGLDCTRFVSAHGLEPANRSCAVDVAAMTRLAMQEHRVRRVARREEAVIDFPIEGGRRYLYTTNPLLEDGYRGTVGLKTGFTEEAGHSLAAVARRGNRMLGVVLLDSPDPGAQAKRLLDAAFERRVRHQPLRAAASRGAARSGGSPASLADAGEVIDPGVVSGSGSSSGSPRK